MEEKIYFTKYLPVEGEIKENDHYISDRGDIFQDKKGTRHYTGDKKVKMFLCSRDIQVGDKIIHPMTGEEVEVLSIINGWIKYGDHPNEIANTGLFKKIGEISPEATWVKEGMRFSESEVEEWWGQAITHYPMIRKLHADTWGYEKLAENCPVVYKVKGPCGHFH